MTEDTKGKAQPRRRGKPIEVWVTDEEKATITERAEEAGMSRSGYLRALGLNTPIRSVVDLKAVADLCRINGDLGRVAGLLKLWLWHWVLMMPKPKKFATRKTVFAF